MTSPTFWKDLLSIILVGAVWGCTNPFLRKGSGSSSLQSGAVDGSISHRKHEKVDKQGLSDDELSQVRPKGFPALLGNKLKSLSRFKHVKVWLPYLLNQSGSVIYYYLLATSDLTLAVPSCNALALAFSAMTSHLLGERVDRPGRALLGAALVTAGVGICITSNVSGSASGARSEL